MENIEQSVSDAEYEGWPVVFSVCKEHKLLFADDEFAHLSDTEHCILCHPVDNDSLGG